MGGGSREKAACLLFLPLFLKFLLAQVSIPDSFTLFKGNPFGMQYDPQSLNDITKKYQDTDIIHNQLIVRLQTLTSSLTVIQAKEYLLQGAGRRLKILTRCIKNIFQIFPIVKTDQVMSDELTDLAINLHAFFVNISGLFDNLGWVFTCEHDLVGDPKEGKLKREDIGLFNRKTQDHLPDALRSYLQSKPLCDWYSNYSKNFRDALAHRIPPYVPHFSINYADQKKYLEIEGKLQTIDFTKDENLEIYENFLDQQKQLKQPSPVFAHSLNEKGQPIWLHAQIIVDYLTIEEVVNKFCEHFQPKVL